MPYHLHQKTSDNQRSATWRGTHHARLIGLLLLGINLLIIYRMTFYQPIAMAHYALWVAVNAVLVGLYLLTRQHVLRPLSLIAQHVQCLRAVYVTEHHGDTPTTPLTLLHMARDVSRFAGFAMEHFQKQQALSDELNNARTIIEQFAQTLEATVAATGREIGTQYQSVLAYAHYLEEQVQTSKLDPSLRYDFDDICESSFNLRLIAGALGGLTSAAPTPAQAVPLAAVMQQTMLALANSLDRRNMKLTSAEVDVSVLAKGDPMVIAQVLWMMLLGMIRYAADESTMRLRCLNSHDGTKALLSIVISELSPRRLSEDERYDHLTRQLNHLTPNMFADTIRIHANIQLAEMLISRQGGDIRVAPLTNSSCEVCLALPIANT